MKEFKDWHLYKDAMWFIKRFDDGIYYANRSVYQGNNSEIEESKLVLRPTTDLTAEELMIMLTNVYEQVYGTDQPCELTGIRMVSGEEGGGMTASSGKLDFWITVSLGGVGVNANGQYLHFCPYYLTTFMLRQSIDLFGLIEAGIALDATKVTGYTRPDPTRD